MSDPRPTEHRANPRRAQDPISSPSNVLSLTRARKPGGEQHDDLITITEARRLFPRLTERHVYRWVATGELPAFKTRFTKYSLYPRRIIGILCEAQLAYRRAEKAAA